VQQGEQVAAGDKFDYEIRGRAVLDEVVQPGDDRDVLEDAQDVRLPAEERAAEVKLPRVGGDHLLDRDRLAGRQRGRLVDDPETAGRERPGAPVLARDGPPQRAR